MPEPPHPPYLRMEEGEDIIFLKLATAMKIFLQYEITINETKRAQALLTEYLLDYKRVRIFSAYAFLD